MPKKKRRQPKRSTPTRATAPTQAERLVERFRAWRTTRGLDPADAWIMGPLIELKSNYFDLPDPTVWPDEETYELVTEVMPRKVHVEQEDHERIAPTLAEFFTFLYETGRWSRRSLPFEDVPDLVDELTDDLPEMLADPTNRGMTGNIIHYALSRGVDPTNQAAMAAFIQEYNALDDDARREITDTGRLGGATGPHPPGAAFGLGAAGSGTPGPAAPGAAFGLGTGGRHLAAVPAWDEEDDDGLGVSPFDDDFDDFDPVDDWPDFLGDPLDGDALSTALQESDEMAVTSSTLMQRADHVMALVADGREVTDTDALRPADTRTLLKAFELDLPARSMWDVAAVSIVWTSLRAAGFVEIRGRRARPAAEVVPWSGPDGHPQDRLAAARVLHAATLEMILGNPLSDDLADPDDLEVSASPWTYLALMKAATPGGVTVTPTSKSLESDLLADEVLNDLVILEEAGLVTLEEAGLVTEEHDDELTFHFDPALLMMTPPLVTAAMDDLMSADESPFSAE